MSPMPKGNRNLGSPGGCGPGLASGPQLVMRGTRPHLTPQSEGFQV